MAFDIVCPSCSANLDVEERSAGQVVACPQCGSSMLVPPPVAYLRRRPAPSSSANLAFAGILLLTVAAIGMAAYVLVGSSRQQSGISTANGKPLSPQTASLKVATENFIAEANGLIRLMEGIPSVRDFNRKRDAVHDAYLKIPTSTDEKSAAYQINVQTKLLMLRFDIARQNLEMQDRIASLGGNQRVSGKREAEEFKSTVRQLESMVAGLR